ncbi:Lrp/AsnC family transcriptional regulator [Saccharopolyspora oryzae]|uniref:Lrp/AsnC family transcriptional regulator n=1 Tax=Saccharopolyspora oryzae TaxID=2997343 RepID=A0ABT4UQI9_9PSEU|nr:Lrp/AsnC family transcriptional regulator [Saccharopolyspora oryzae]MDA3623967.1 Lrp/AsnC family transcriptional regulator [Saccharopolyspora oryzae]
MQDSTGIADELDLAIVNCLQINPRASWTQLSRALDVDPVTVARRWNRLSDSGTAWVTGRAAGHGTPESCLAVIELSCAASETLAIANRIARLPHVLNLEHTSGPRALTILVEVRDLAFLSRFLLDSLGSIPGVVSASSHAVTKVLTMGDHWKLKVIDATQRAIMARSLPRHLTQLAANRPDGLRPYDDVDKQLILLLGEDGRMPVSTMAGRTGLSESTIRRRLAELVNHGRVVLRCDIALPASGWPVITWLWAHVSPDDAETIRTILHRIEGIRACFQISGGQPNLLLGLNTRSLREAPVIEAKLADAAPRLSIIDRSMVLRSIKRMGRELDEAGRSVASIPMNIWAAPTSPPPHRETTT